MRLFVGIAIEEDIRQRIAEYIKPLQDADLDNKWVRPGSLHVTLKFIGESRRVEELKGELASVRLRPITMNFRGVGFFTPRSPRIFWAGVDAGPELEQLANSIEERLYRIGIPKEPRNYDEYQPHVTLARTGSGRPQGSSHDRHKPAMWKLKEAVGAQPSPDFGTMTAEEFILFRSETLPGGSRYTPLERFQLNRSH